MKSNKIEICKEACFVIDHTANFLEDSGARLELDASQKNKNILSFLSTIQKTTWTCVVEGVIEYCRVIYDIFSSSYKILVLCSNENAINVNDFEDKYQNIQQVLKGFGDLGPPAEDYKIPTSVYNGVEHGTKELIRLASESSNNSTKRLIVVVSLEDESDARSIGNVVWEIQNEHDKKGLCNIDLLVINISNNGSEIFVPMKKISPHLQMSTITFTSTNCSTQIPLLARKHYCLRSTIITGIPMKEEQHAGTSANYDVEIIHSAAAHHETEWLHSFENSTNHLDDCSKANVTLKWCTPKANSLQDIQPCVGVHRVTPSEVNSRPAACLIMFLLQGRTVMLEQPRKSGTKILTHMLNSHGGDIFIHVLVSGRSPLEDPPSITEGVGGRVTDYRVTDFGRLMKENRLAPYQEAEDEQSNNSALDRLERYSKHWPMVICDTLIFNMQANLEPLLSLLMKPTLTEDEVQECKKVVYKLQAMEGRNDSLPLPIVTLKGKHSKKEEQYKQVWTELDVFIEGASTTSPMHKKVLDCLRGTQDPPLSSNDINLIDDKLNQNSTEKMRVDTSSERKAVKEAPSDPRRRRRTSDSSSHAPQVKEVATTPKKSPRNEEPSSKLRRTGSRGSLNSLTPIVQAKSSLWSIWTNHMNLAASRFHEEFLGRKSDNFKLYANDADPTGLNDSKGYSKSSKEW